MNKIHFAKVNLTFTTLKDLCKNHGDRRFFFQFEIIINVSASFEYLCYGSTTIV